MYQQDNISTSAEICESYQHAENSRLRLAVKSIGFWTYVGVGLSGVFLTINTGQAYWALSKLGGLATDSVFNSVITGLIAAALVLAANVVSIRLGVGKSKLVGVIILVGLMIFSVTTSALHLSFSVLGGYDASVKGSTEYKLALADYQLSAKAYQDVLRSAEQADDKGKTSDAGWIRNRYAPPLKDAATQSRLRLEAVSANGGGTEASVLSEVSSFFNMPPPQFSTAFAVFSVLLMEVTRIWLAFSTAKQIGKILSEAPRLGKSRPELRAVA